MWQSPAIVPFTVSHTAVAWPLSRLVPNLPTAALAIGAMSPDFEYLLRLAPRSHLSHTPLGVLTFCVPVSLATWLVYRHLVRPSLLDLLPRAMCREVQQWEGRRDFAWTFVWATLAILVGAFTHLAWDAFTHTDGVVVAAIPALRAPVLATHDLRWCQLFQHGSTLFGLAVLFLWAKRTWNRFPATARRFEPAQLASLITSALCLLAASTVGALLDGERAMGAGLIPVLAFAAVGAMDGAAIALLAIGIFGRLGKNKRAMQVE